MQLLKQIVYTEYFALTQIDGWLSPAYGERDINVFIYFRPRNMKTHLSSDSTRQHCNMTIPCTVFQESLF